MSGQARRLPPRRRPEAAVALVALLLGGTPAARAEGDTPGFWTSVLEKLDMKAKPATMPDFVKTTRPPSDRLTFMPTGPVPRDQAVPVKSAAEVEAAKAALDSAQAAQLHPRVPAAKKAKPVTGAPKTP